LPIKQKQQFYKVRCCGFFLGLPNLDEPTGLDKFESMMIRVEVIRLHIQVQRALMFSSVRTKSLKEASPKGQS
jgi:hypothetical protein